MARVSCCASARPPPSPLFPYTTLFRSEFLPAAVLHPSADRRVSEEQFDLSEILERDRGRVDAEELDLEAALRQQIAHRILVEGPSRTAARLLPIVAVVGAENEGPSRPQGSRRMPHDLRGHAQ